MEALLRQLHRLDVVLSVPVGVSHPLDGRVQQAAPESIRRTSATGAAALLANGNDRAAAGTSARS